MTARAPDRLTANPGACDLLIQNAYVYSMDGDRNVFPNGAIAVDGNTIAAVGPESEVIRRYEPKRTIDAHGALVHPGFIDSHYHVTNHLARGVIPDAPGHGAVPAPSAPGGRSIGEYSRWFNALEDEDEYVSSLLACVEMVRAGFTCFMDPGTAFEPDAAAAAVEAVGIRGSLADPFLWDVEGILGMAAEIDRVPLSLDRCLSSLGKELRRNDDGFESLVRGHVAVYGRGSASDELEVAAKDCARGAGVVLTQHQNLEPVGTEADDALRGAHVLKHFAKLGLLDDKSTFAHMNVVRDDEFDLVASSGMSIAWQPGGYQFYSIAASVPTRMPDLLAAGVNLTICVDTSKLWTFGDMPRIAYLVARAQNHYFTFADLFEMQTVRAAKAVGMDRWIGSLEPGKRADIVIRTEDLAEAQPGLSKITELLFMARSQSVDTVIADGKIVLKNRRSTMVDEGYVYEQARLSASRVAHRADLWPDPPWPVRI